LLAEVLLLSLKKKDKLQEATEEVREKGAPLFAASSRAATASPGDNGGKTRGRRERKGVS
jgi:hypothetical protein